MNILISITTNWNCGDDFIRFGVKNILKQFFPNANYIHYDRNPNNMVDYPDNQTLKHGLRGNFMNNPIDWSVIDLVVLAGTPEWLHHPLEPIYDGLMKHPVSLWAIGVGYTEPEFVLPLREEEINVLKRSTTLVITRQRELSARLEYWFDINAHTLPCPSLFCFENYPEKTKNTLSYTSHSIAEIGGNSYFDSDPHEMLRYIGQYRRVISNRLHGTIAAISSGANVTMENDSFRCREAIKLFEDVMETDRHYITAFKTRIFNDYYNIINKHYAKTS